MFTKDEIAVLRGLIGNALDQDHDSPEGDYLWWLVEAAPMQPTDEQLDEVREALRTADEKLAAEEVAS